MLFLYYFAAFLNFIVCAKDEMNPAGSKGVKRGGSAENKGNCGNTGESAARCH